MTEAETPPITPRASAQAGHYTTNMGRQGPITTRRSVLTGTPLAALAATMPGTTLGQVKADKDIIALCGEVIALEGAINGAYPHYPTLADEPGFNAATDGLFTNQNRLFERLAGMRAATLDGFRAQAKAIMTCFPDDICQPTDSFACMVACLVSGLAGGVA